MDVYDLLLGDSLTPTDPRVPALLKLTDDPAVIRAILHKRAKYRTWVTVTQRKWQAKTRRPQRAHHSDSLAIRERYVRCL